MNCASISIQLALGGDRLHGLSHMLRPWKCCPTLHTPIVVFCYNSLSELRQVLRVLLEKWISSDFRTNQKKEAKKKWTPSKSNKCTNLHHFWYYQSSLWYFSDFGTFLQEEQHWTRKSRSHRGRIVLKEHLMLLSVFKISKTIQSQLRIKFGWVNLKYVYNIRFFSFEECLTL